MLLRKRTSCCHRWTIFNFLKYLLLLAVYIRIPTELECCSKMVSSKNGSFPCEKPPMFMDVPKWGSLLWHPKYKLMFCYDVAHSSRIQQWRIGAQYCNLLRTTACWLICRLFFVVNNVSCAYADDLSFLNDKLKVGTSISLILSKYFLFSGVLVHPALGWMLLPVRFCMMWWIMKVVNCNVTGSKI